MIRAWGLLALAAALTGCPIAYDDDDSGAPGGVAPLIDFSAPSAAIQALADGGSIAFSARGEDPDSLDLTWRFDLDGGFEVGGESGDGQFDVTWTLDYRPELADNAADVLFVVSDGTQ